MKTRIMLDLETLGTAPGSAILAIGAVMFTGGKIEQEFYRRTDLRSSTQAGLTMDPDTVLWWLKQPDEARLEITNEGEHLAHVLQHFYEWVDVNGGAEVEMWGNGASFDNVLLSVAYEKLGLKRPWKYSNDRCYRTVKNLYIGGAEIVRTGTHHNALDDARSQALHLMAMIPAL
jgi:hypothetical protein